MRNRCHRRSVAAGPGTPGRHCWLVVWWHSHRVNRRPGGSNLTGSARSRAASWTAVALYRFGVGGEGSQRVPKLSTPIRRENSTSVRLVRLSPKRQRTAAVQDLAEFTRRWRGRQASWTAVALYRFGVGCEGCQRVPNRSTPVRWESSTFVRLVRPSPKRQRTAAVQDLAEFTRRWRGRAASWTAVVFYRFGMGCEGGQRVPKLSTPVRWESSTSVRLVRPSPKRQRTAAVQNLAVDLCGDTDFSGRFRHGLD